jgi:hypothetical protein
MRDQESQPLLSPANQNSVSLNSLDHAMPAHKGTSWVTTASLIVANMLGAGVLGLPAAVAGLGWGPAAGLMVVITIMSIIGGLNIGEFKPVLPGSAGCLNFSPAVQPSHTFLSLP